jgi:hypothetical protein
MHISSVQRLHFFSQSIHLIEHHKVLATILVVIAVMGLESVWHPTVAHRMVTPDLEQTLTRLDDPQDAQEL